MAPNLKPINRRALRRYGEFWRALALVGNALAEAEQLAAKASDTQSSRPTAGEKQTAHWSAPTPEELRSAAKKAGRALHTMSSAAKKWEAELVSREWRR
ncbi:MAG: hypothetical protein EKK42_13840 [Pseudonocardiaceae bacterium]|nr:MAG: hypothetical protein EKK42_13840 [Pseudonocardiaceae bacterium]